MVAYRCFRHLHSSNMSLSILFGSLLGSMLSSPTDPPTLQNLDILYGRETAAPSIQTSQIPSLQAFETASLQASKPPNASASASVQSLILLPSASAAASVRFRPPPLPRWLPRPLPLQLPSASASASVRFRPSPLPRPPPIMLPLPLMRLRLLLLRRMFLRLPRRSRVGWG